MILIIDLKLNTEQINQILKNKKQIKQKFETITKPTRQNPNLIDQNFKLFNCIYITINRISQRQKPMSIIYALIAKQTQTDIINLCSYDSAHGNYPQITNEILNNIQIKQSVTYRYNEEYNYHILKDGLLIFVCLAQSSMKLKVCFGFLEQIKKRFREKYSNQEIMLAKTYDMSTSFAETFKNQMTYYNSSRDQDKKQVLMKQLSSLQQIMSENIDKVLQREEKVEILVKKTAKLDSIADEIKKSASKIKKQSFWAKHKLKMFIAGLVALGVLALFIVI